MSKKNFTKKLIACMSMICMLMALIFPAEQEAVQAASIPKITYNKWKTLTYQGTTQKYNCTVKKDGYAVVLVNVTSYRLDEDEDLDYDESHAPRLKVTINKRGSKSSDEVSADIDSGTVQTGPIRLTKGDVLRLTVSGEDGIEQAKYKVKVVTYDTVLSMSHFEASQNTFASIELLGAPSNKVKWESTNEDVAIVGKRGNITTIAAGSCEIIATYKGVEYICIVEVYHDPAMESEGEDFSEEEFTDEDHTEEDWEDFME